MKHIGMLFCNKDIKHQTAGCGGALPLISLLRWQRQVDLCKLEAIQAGFVPINKNRENEERRRK